MRSARPAIAILACAVALAACRTEYRSYAERPVTGDGGPIEAVDGRRVFFRIGPGFYRDPPNCVVVLPAPDGQAMTKNAVQIEKAIARHLRDKIARVVGPLGRARAVRRHALDLAHAGDRRRFAGLERCDAFLSWRVTGSSNGYFLVWSRRDFGLQVELFREAGRSLWKASHTTARSDGNLPFSLFSAPVAMYEAATFSTDDDILPSMVDDTLRRIVASLPDTR
jgi:hypothetical protein